MEVFRCTLRGYYLCRGPSIMALPLHGVKCSRSIFPPISRWYHASPQLCKWPEQLNIEIKKYKAEKLKIWEGMSIWDLAKSMKKDLDYVNQVLKPAFRSRMDKSTGEIYDLRSVKDFLEKENIDFSVAKVSAKKVEENEKNVRKSILATSVSNKTEVQRPPVVTIMGHVDHGKTTLLDALRNSNIVAKEFGGITQHIGAFSVTVTPGKTVTFIDTPGHAAFSAMRNRGAEVTDIVVLIVAADDGVMEQTKESIKMAKNAGVKIIVAINKIDKGENAVARIKQELLQLGIQAEDMGGDVQCVNISALKRINLDLLIQSILVEAEMMGLTGDPTSSVQGVVIESSVGKGGKVATLIIKRGTLRKRAVLVAGGTFATVRGMYDENGRELSQVTLSQPAEIYGWRDLPSAGEKVYEVKSQKEANILIREYKKEEMRRKMLGNYIQIQEKSVEEKVEFHNRKRKCEELKMRGDIEGLKKFYAERPVNRHEEKTKLNIIIKGDVDGSVEALLDVLETYDCNEECELNIVRFGVGEVTESDVELAKTFDAILYCFNLDYPHRLKALIRENNLTIRFHTVIYNFIDDLKDELSQRIGSVEEDVIIGTGEVLQNFNISERKKTVSVAGSVCLTGEFKTNMIFRVIRKNETIFEGPIRSLRHFKNEVNTVKKGSQCGIMLENFTQEFQEHDQIICLEKKLVQKGTSWNPGF